LGDVVMGNSRYFERGEPWKILSSFHGPFRITESLPETSNYRVELIPACGNPTTTELKYRFLMYVCVEKLS
jgi:hypothetical protein